MTPISDSTLDYRVLSILGDKNVQHKESVYTIYLREKILKGFSFEAFESVRRGIDIPQKNLAGILGMTESTLTRRKRSRQSFTTQESDRLYRVARIIALAFEVFGEEDMAQKWMKRPNAELQGEIPLNLLSTEIGASLVKDELYRILDGIYI